MLKIRNEKVKKILIDIGITLFIDLLSLGIMLVLDRTYIHDENIFLIFILAVLIIIIETKTIYYGLFSSILFCFSFNFFLTDPRYSFVMDDLNYYISFSVFILISLIFSSLVIKLQNKVKQSQDNEKRMNILYKFSRELLNYHSEKEIYETACACLKDNINYPFYLKNSRANVVNGDIFEVEDETREAIEYSINQYAIVGKNQAVYSSINYLIFPVCSKINKFGALIIKICDNNFNQSEFNFIKSIINELTVVLEREKVIFEREVSESAREKEKLKSTLLRSLSHDLKTPLTSIESGSLFLQENFDKIDKGEVKELLSNIYSESVSLYSFVNNLLNISKLGDKDSIVKEYESLDDILQNVKDYFKNYQIDKTIVYPNDASILVYCNAQLIIQVFINLIDNAIKYTKSGSTIYIDVSNDNSRLYVEVKDNGGGVKEEKMNSLFKDLFMASAKKDAYRSSGLGLGICKAIIEAHNGTIKCENNDIGGATFKFNILLKKGEN